MKDRKKPEKFLLPHGMPSDDREFAFSSRVPPKALKIKAPYKSWHYQDTALRGVQRPQSHSGSADGGARLCDAYVTGRGVVSSRAAGQMPRSVFRPCRPHVSAFGPGLSPRSLLRGDLHGLRHPRSEEKQMHAWLLQGGLMTVCGLLFGLILRGAASRGLHAPYRG